ncbi:MAG: diacylglycerol kinase family lipid kinase [Candidatus Auribacter fodinae]|jgi:YegS/Rv2252/BmrU family lipid kinase|uniref:Diacylglycerol kinase family lipid kinase n=1 Tax=Candidatus Auribacter fodinae TaxID=2093366 RepID=A0A3A4QZD6_9BACT|nr:MAG: diacylglycerol kinase family lipid kinase [Candidatus Auribacter fodinae]
MKKRAYLIYNPHSGRGKYKSTLRAVLQQLKPHFEVELIVSNSREFARDIAAKVTAKEDKPLVVVAGGDGTINDVVNGADLRNMVLGIIPVGSVNVIAYDLKIPSRIEHACSILANNSSVRTLDVSKANNTRFIFGAGVGFDAAVVKNVELKHKLLLGKTVYAWQSMRLMKSFKPFEASVTCDGNEVYSGLVFDLIIGKSNYYAGRFKLFDDASYTNGRLNGAIFTHSTIPQYIKGCAAFFMQMKDRRRIYFSGSNIEVKTDSAVPYHVDGDAGSASPVSFHINSQKLYVVAPQY